MSIRLERPEDASQVRQINELAFGQPLEANLVDTLRRSCTESLSLVAEGDARGRRRGGASALHAGRRRVCRAASGRHGTGTDGRAARPAAAGHRLAARDARSRILRERGCPFVVVVGHPEFYPRFGFEPASTHGLVCQWEGVPDAAFMVLALDAQAMAGVSGVANYRDEFNEAT